MQTSYVRKEGDMLKLPTDRPVRVGIVGGGQLARMMVLDAARLGLDLTVLAAERDEGSRGVIAVRDGDPNDPQDLQDLADSTDALTLDHELVPLEYWRAIESQGQVLHPGAETLQYTNKIVQRTAFAQAGLPVPPFSVVHTAKEIDGFASEHGWPLILKSPLGGYDGHGIMQVRSMDEANVMLEAAAGQPLLAEPHLPLRDEIAVLVCTSASGERVVYDPVRTIQENGMCAAVHVGEGVLDPAVASEASKIAQRTADLVGSVGILAVEFFVTKDGLTINEIAPRPHNSGHHTIDSCQTSQFENHLRAVVGWPLGSPAMTCKAAAMVNVIGTQAGDPTTRVGRALTTQAKVHVYDKTWRPGRKLGHVTAVANDIDTAEARAERAAQLLMYG
ncbi:5-(carboxyamino)imidazole ribonucleotide synthase [Stomatohabitans albus]|uniref:5-(carboxyamino)imidazole ribonucleotide synthase n=1 Tax=Stomatohabitans albus TaxID=3110766 RepID=UPI00300C7228